MSQFLSDIEKIRSQAKESLNFGAVTLANTTDKEQILRLLDAALATEWICVLRYSQHAASASGFQAEAIAAEFSQHATEELQHAQLLAQRIQQLRGTPNLDPIHLAETSHSQYTQCNTLAEMVKENLIAERIAIISYTETIRYVGEGDPTTRRMLEEILKTEEEHADELASLLDTFDPREPMH